MSDTLIKTLQNSEYSELKDNIDQVVAKKIVGRIAEKRVEVLKKINGFQGTPTGE